MSRDPIGERGGLNLYGFVGNNTINLIDPFGLDDDMNFVTKIRQFHNQPHFNADLTGTDREGSLSKAKVFEKMEDAIKNIPNAAKDGLKKVADSAEKTGEKIQCAFPPEKISNEPQWWLDSSGLESHMNWNASPIHYEKYVVWGFTYAYLETITLTNIEMEWNAIFKPE